MQCVVFGHANDTSPGWLGPIFKAQKFPTRPVPNNVPEEKWETGKMGGGGEWGK